MTLPTNKQSRATMPVTPERARVALIGTPGAGKTTLGATWAPETTLIVDTQQGTILLDGEHYVAHINNWPGFVTVVDDVCAGGHHYRGMQIDLIDDVWNFCDVHHAGKGALLATSTDDFQRARRDAIGAFRYQIGRLLATDLGIWFIGHAKEKQDEGTKVMRYHADINRAVGGEIGGYILGACQFVFLAETLGPTRQLHTQPTGRFEAKSRVPMPEPMELDARQIWLAMNAGLNPVAPVAAPVNGAAVTATPELEGAAA